MFLMIFVSCRDWFKRDIQSESIFDTIFFPVPSQRSSLARPPDIRVTCPARLQYEAAVYYHHHLGGQVAVLMLCEDAAFALEHGHRHPGVFVQNMDQFLTGFWPDLTAARDIHDGVKATLLADGAHRGELGMALEPHDIVCCEASWLIGL